MTSLFSLYERFFFVFSSQESAVLQGKLRPQPERIAKPDRVAGNSDVKLREKQKDFELRDYQAQRVRI